MDAQPGPGHALFWFQAVSAERPSISGEFKLAIVTRYLCLSLQFWSKVQTPQEVNVNMSNVWCQNRSEHGQNGELCSWTRVHVDYFTELSCIKQIKELAQPARFLASPRTIVRLLRVVVHYLIQIQTTAWQVGQCIIPPQPHSSRDRSSSSSPCLAMLPAAFLFGTKAFVCLARLWLWMLKSLGWKKTTHTSRRPRRTFHDALCQARQKGQTWLAW